jgi:hypothetical protein
MLLPFLKKKLCVGCLSERAENTLSVGSRLKAEKQTCANSGKNYVDAEGLPRGSDEVQNANSKLETSKQLGVFDHDEETRNTYHSSRYELKLRTKKIEPSYLTLASLGSKAK